MKNSINYEKYFVAYLDVLGFTDMVMQNKKHKIEHYINFIEDALSKLNNIPSKKDIGALTISDSIILVIPVEEDINKSMHNLRQLCIVILSLQKKLYKYDDDIWLRGGISVGEIYFNKNKNQIVGKAYIDAFKIEENIAKNSRVVLDNAIMNEFGIDNASDFIDYMNNFNQSRPESWTYNVLYEWNSYDILEKDVPLFIDYIHTDDEIRAALSKIKKNATDIRVYTKYQWLTKYLYTKTSDADLLKELSKV